MTNGAQQQIDFTVSRDNLYREESFTDIKVAAIRRLVPVKPDGSDDESRTTMFMAQTQIMTPGGPFVLQAMLNAKTIEEAMDEFPAAMKVEMNKMIAAAEQQQEKQDSQIIT